MENMLVLLANLFCKTDVYIILGFFVFNIIVYLVTKYTLTEYDKMIHPRIDKSIFYRGTPMCSESDINEVKKMRRKALFWYTLYANITAVFPLLGILGTVAALVTYSGDTMMESFMVALNTTLLGVLFAIICKAADSSISVPLELLLEESDHYIQYYYNERNITNE